MRFRLQSSQCIGYTTRGSGPVCVLLHPIATSAAFWDPIVERLQTHIRLVAVDLFGHGESDVPNARFSLEDLGSGVVELIRSLVGQPVVVVGCSIGGMVAQSVALQAPETVAGLVLTNTAHTLEPPARAAMEQRAAAALEGMADLIEPTIARWFSEDFQKKHPAVIEQYRAALQSADPMVHSWGWRAIQRLDFGERLREIRVPALVVTGSLDVSTPPSAAQKIVNVLPHARYFEIEGASHMTPVERPDEFARLLLEFLQGLKHVRRAP